MTNNGDMPAKAYQEGQKLFYDLYKHITTLSSGSILILAAFLEKFFKSPQWKGLIAVCFFAFVLAIMSSVIAMIMISSSVLRSGKPTSLEARIGGVGILVSISSFLGGIICLVIFALKNF